MQKRYGYYGGKGPSADVVEEAYKSQHYRHTYDSEDDYYGYNK